MKWPNLTLLSFALILISNLKHVFYNNLGSLKTLRKSFTLTRYRTVQSKKRLKFELKEKKKYKGVNQSRIRIEVYHSPVPLTISEKYRTQQSREIFSRIFNSAGFFADLFTL
jgi:hypothetical protein